MNRAESLKIINAFIEELGPPAKSAPATKAAVKEAPATAAPAAVKPTAPQASGLGQLVAGCAGFEISSAIEEPPPAPEQDGLTVLMRTCAGFEIGSSQVEICVETAETGPAPVPEPVKAPVPAADAEDKQEISPERAAARKALVNLSNKPLLLSLLQYYASESQRPTPSRSMLKTTKEQVMKHWPMLALTPLINALDGAAA